MILQQHGLVFFACCGRCWQLTFILLPAWAMASCLITALGLSLEKRQSLAIMYHCCRYGASCCGMRCWLKRFACLETNIPVGELCLAYKCTCRQLSSIIREEQPSIAQLFECQARFCRRRWPILSVRGLQRDVMQSQCMLIGGMCLQSMIQCQPAPVALMGFFTARSAVQ